MDGCTATWDCHGGWVHVPGLRASRTASHAGQRQWGLALRHWLCATGAGCIRTQGGTGWGGCGTAVTDTPQATCAWSITDRHPAWRQADNANGGGRSASPLYGRVT